jgi:hypothetical protein
VADIIKGEAAVNAPEQMIERDVFVEAEIIEQPRRRSLKAHHHNLSRKSMGFNESRHSSAGNQATGRMIADGAKEAPE